MKNPKVSEQVLTKPATPVDTTPAEKVPVEKLIEQAKLRKAIAAALMRYKRWGIGKLLTQAEFDAAVHEINTKPVSQV